ncbi:MAG: AAA family ATPase, partial [Rhodospirillales bacterium]|nr:AAA family ATPase [Rhodospirillales bacterium]
MLQFNKLRLSGFKSFIDLTDISIEPGLTGIVGPNGCGKSNLVEALRWAMGETSAKQIRGGEMDDVIFGGTANRPPRNIAEVVICLDNAARSAPAMFNDFEDIEISRRIERGSGSTYRVNGREVRARDVQLLFADSATGARSTALVSQGRVGAVIAAKPTARRALLEEAAGITGLHSRRHEAELRLRAAETNLTRLDDVLGTLEVQFNSLKKQARQATRYRNISDHIRRAEAALYLVRWLAAEEELESGRVRLSEAETEVTEMTRRAAAAAARQGETASDLPALRQAEAEAAAELQRLVLARDGLETESQRVETERQESQTRLDHVNADIERETGLADEAAAAMKRLDAERREIETARNGEAQALTEAGKRLAEIGEKVGALDRRLAELTEQVADDEARRDSLSHRVAELHQRKERLTARAGDISEQRTALEVEAVDSQELKAAGAALSEAREGLEKARTSAEAAEDARAEASVTAASALSGLQAAETSAARLDAEAQALTDILDAGKTDLWPPL